MIGLDTNILVRILTGDDRAQAEQAAQLIRERCSSENPGFVNCVVIAELVWVLKNLYDYERRDIARALERLLTSRDLAIEAYEHVRSAFLTYQSSNCDFIDALISELNRLRGCEITATFDRKAARLDGFMRID
jgi:predicted nucleic-acid-binding protein